MPRGVQPAILILHFSLLHLPPHRSPVHAFVVAEKMIKDGFNEKLKKREASPAGHSHFSFLILNRLAIDLPERVVRGMKFARTAFPPPNANGCRRDR